jgi:hypothetical protein
MTAATAALFFVLVGLLPAPCARAALIVNSDSLVSATNVNVDGVLYDVTFTGSQTCAQLYDGCNALSNFAFNSVAQSTAAMMALGDQVFTVFSVPVLGHARDDLASGRDLFSRASWSTRAV